MSKRGQIVAIELADWRPTMENVTWLSVALLLVAVPHVSRLPVWVSVAFVALSVWRWGSLRHNWWTPGIWLTALMSGAAVLGIGFEYRTILGRDAGVALLTVLAAMKLLEVRTARDAYVTICLALFLTITNFLYSQSIAMGLYMVVATLVSMTALVTVTHAGGALAVRTRARVAGAVVLQAVPVMLVLFVVFPRIPGPLWGLPNDAHSGRTGLSETMSPGDISNLSQSGAVAFRVKFDGPPPPAEALYWRGPVLEVTDGRRWTRAPRASSPMSIGATQLLGASVGYEVTLEPTHKRWIFALEMPREVSADAVANSRGELRVDKPLRERIKYRAQSVLNFKFDASSPVELREALRLRKGFHPNARRLARKWRSETDDTEALVNFALDYFRDGPFVYTLRPPLLDGDAIDEFMFLTHRGFCEHYAAAFTVLMRAAGVPARVVTGYQGGEWNEVGGYWIVRQRDAHAWTEVWMRGVGWRRVDPTAMVSPERIGQGIDVVMPESAGDAILGLPPGGEVARLWRRVRLGWDSVNDSWNQWVLGYGPEHQRELFAGLGIDLRDWRHAGSVFVGAIVIAVLLTAAWISRQRVPAPPAVTAYSMYCRRLERAGVVRERWEGPNDFAARAKELLPDYADEIDRITRLYLDIRYASTDGLEKELEACVKSFRPGRLATHRI
jgi:protein-glutamine gamma-glutamyltransferase